MFNFLLGNDVLSAIVAFILVLIPAVLIHELGHFMAAKMVGITILEFGIGMPPRAVKLFTRGGTDYTLNWLPLGGFVRPLGEDVVRQLGNDAVEEDREEAVHRGIKKTLSVNEAPPLARIFFMAAGAITNFLLAFILFVVIAMIGIPQIAGGVVSVDNVVPNSVLAQAGVQSSDVIASINGENFSSADDLLQRLVAAAGQPVTLGVIRDEQPVDLTLTPDLTAAQAVSETHPIVLDVADGSPAASAGLVVNDMITGFNGQPVANFEALQQLTAAHFGQEVTLSVWRSGEPVTVSLTPRANPPAGEGSMGIGVRTGVMNAALGIAFQEGQKSELRSLPVGEAAQYSVSRISEVLTMIASIPGQILQGTADGSSLRPLSPVGISQAGAVFLQESIQRNQPGIILEFMALISLALGLTNLLPIPALDGGRIFFVLIEIVRGRPIAPEREGMVHLIGLALMLSLMLVVMLNDIANPLTDLLR